MSRKKLEKVTESTDMKEIMSVMEKLLYWAAIIESSDDAIISISMEGTIISWNKGAERLYGYTAQEIIGQPVSVLMPSEKEDDFPFILKQLRTGKRMEHYETKRQAKDGKIIDVSITVSPIKDSTGNIIGASKIARDISMRIEVEKRREEFISTASHELKTPITTQKAYGELLERLIKKNGHVEYLPYIEKMNVQTIKITKLIEDLLELSRMRNGKFVMVNKVFAYEDLISEVVEDMQRITSQHIQWKSKLDVKVKGDRDRIGQVITNLVTNASKYSPNADKIVVAAFIQDDKVITTVTDYGIGIDDSYYEKIFELFFRVTSHDEKTYPGMGIGLNFSKEIIKRHGGNIWVESKKGVGSTFFFSLPIIKNN